MNTRPQARLSLSLSMLLVVLLLLLGCDEDSSENPAPETQPDATSVPDADAGLDAAMDAGSTPTVDAGIDIRSDAKVDRGSDTPLDGTEDTGVQAPADPDVNGDGVLNILVLGTNQSIQRNGNAFSPDGIAQELEKILSADTDLAVDVHVVAEDIHRSKLLTTGYGQAGSEYDWTYRAHSLAQYYHWPEGHDDRMKLLEGTHGVDWDQVVIAGDPHIVAESPGYYALGVDKVASKVTEGHAQPLLLMVWPKDETSPWRDHFAEFTSRTGDGASVELPVVPAGLVWADLPAEKKDVAESHPTPNGAYAAAATLYAHLYRRSASASDYVYDDAIANAAHATFTDTVTQTHYTGRRTFVSPFKGADIPARVLRYNHTGTSSENGILGGLQWVLAKAQVKLQRGGESPIHFNYGRANTEFEAHKRYEIDPNKFDFSLGFPMQDHSNHGDITMLYGLDQRRHESENGTDLGVARKMVRDSEIPQARAIPVRTLFAEMREAIPDQSAYSDGWHMNADLNRAIGAYMFTLLTGHCALDAEPVDRDSSEWRTWTAHKTGYETAWTLMHLRGRAPGFRVTPDSPESTSISPSEAAGLSISFVNRPTADVTVRLSTNNDAALSYDPAELVFTPDNHDIPQNVSMLAVNGSMGMDAVTITASTESTDPVFDSIEDRWTYSIVR